MRGALSLMLLVLAAPAAFAQKAKPLTPAGIPAEPLALRVGEAMSPRALVARPPVLAGLVSWSIESRRHRGGYSCMAVSPNGRFLATGGIDGTIRVWDTTSGSLVRALIGHSYYVYGLAWSPDGNTLASAGSFDATVRLWDTRTGQPLKILKGHPAYVVQVAWNPDGRSVMAAGGESGIVSRWDVMNGKHLGKLDLGRPVRSIAWHPDGRTAVVVAHTLALSICDMDEFKVTRSLGDVKSDFLNAEWSPDGKTLAAGSATGTHIFEGEELKPARVLEGPANAVAWSPDGKQLAVSSTAAGTIKLWDSASGAAGKSFPASATLLHYVPGGQHVITGNGLSFGVHDLGTGKSERSFEIAGTGPPLWYSAKPLVTGIGTPKLSLWDATTGKLLRHLEGHTSSITAIAWSPDGKTLATASYDKTVKLWDYGAGTAVRTFDKHTAPVLSLAFSIDGKLIASGGSDKLARIWNPANSEVSQTLKGHTAEVTALAWGPGLAGTLATASSDKTVRTWNSKTGAPGREFTETGESAILCLAWSPDGKILASGHYDHRVRLWQISNGQMIHTLEEPGSPPQVSSLAWATNDLIASGRGNHTLQIWNGKTGAKIHTIPMMAPVQRVAWAPGAATVVSCNQDRTTRFVETATGLLRGVMLAEPNQVILVSADGHYRADNPAADLVFVAQTEKTQDTYQPAAFATKYKWRNQSTSIKLLGR